MNSRDLYLRDARTALACRRHSRGQSRKTEVRMNRRELAEHVKMCAHTGRTIVRRPFVAVEVWITWQREAVSGWGLAKCCRPGAWREETGLVIARGRAISDLVEQIWQTELDEQMWHNAMLCAAEVSPP
jgi:hypothetical protein